MANGEILTCVKYYIFYWTSEFPFVTGLCVFSKLENIARIMLNQIACVEMANLCCLLLKIPDRSADTLGFTPTGMPPVGS